MALKLEIQTNQILKNDDEVCIPSLSSILLAVTDLYMEPLCTLEWAQWNLCSLEFKFDDARLSS